MVRIGGSTEKGQHIKEHDYYTPTGEFRIDRGGSQILLNCLMYKMCYYRFGSVYTEQGSTPVYAATSLNPSQLKMLTRDSLPGLLSSVYPVVIQHHNLTCIVLFCV